MELHPLAKNFKQFQYTPRFNMLLMQQGLHLGTGGIPAQLAYMIINTIMVPTAEKYRNVMVSKDQPFTAQEVFSMIPSAERSFEEREKDMQMKFVTCKKGCSTCCSLRVSMSKEEAPKLKRYIEENNISYSKERLQKQAGVPMSEWYSKLSREDRRCAFLDEEEGICKVYEARPAACRLQNLASNPEDCVKIDLSGGDGQVKYIIMEEAEILLSFALMLTESQQENIASIMSEIL